MTQETNKTLMMSRTTLDTNHQLALFKERLKSLRGEERLQDVADCIGISRATLGFYENGERRPDVEILMKLANHYHVSCDYLLGFTDCPTPEIQERAITELTGLTPRSIQTLRGYKSNNDRTPENAFDTTPVSASLLLSVLNKLLHPSTNILDNITYYLYGNFEYFYDDNNAVDENLYQHISSLGLFDKKLGLDYSDDYDYLTQVFLLMIQKELMQLRDEVQKDLPTRILPIAKSGSDDADDYFSEEYL